MYTVKYSSRTLYAFVTPSYRLQSTFYLLCPVKRLAANLTGIHYMPAVELLSSPADPDLHSRLPVTESMKLDARAEVIFIL